MSNTILFYCPQFVTIHRLVVNIEIDLNNCKFIYSFGRKFVRLRTVNTICLISSRGRFDFNQITMVLNRIVLFLTFLFPDVPFLRNRFVSVYTFITLNRFKLIVVVFMLCLLFLRRAISCHGLLTSVSAFEVQIYRIYSTSVPTIKFN